MLPNFATIFLRRGAIYYGSQGKEVKVRMKEYLSLMRVLDVKIEREKRRS